MEKKLYVLPDAEIISFATEDIMTTSGGDNGGDDTNWPEWS